jgi:hypothetical protein
MIPMLQSRLREAQTIASFHFALEAVIQKYQQKVGMFDEIGAIEALNFMVSEVDENELASKFAREALATIGKTVPYQKLQQQTSVENTNKVVCNCNNQTENASPKKQIDVFISYRRSNGSQLASLITMFLRLRGYKVHIDTLTRRNMIESA